MPTVPTYNDLKVQGTTDPGERFSGGMSPQQAAMPGEQLSALGGAQMKAGANGVDVASQMQQDVNNVRVVDAMNQARQHAMDLMTNPDSGYMNLKGKDALERPNGVALPDEYGAKLDSNLSDVSQSLSNPMQQRMFHEQASQLATSFRGDVEQHMLGEFRSFHQSAYQGQIELAQQDPNPANAQQNIENVKGAVYGLNKMGAPGYESANEAQAKELDITSGIHTNNIMSAVLHGDLTGASNYYNKVLGSGELNADHNLSISQTLNEKTDAYNAMQAVGQTQKEMQPLLQPTEFDRFANLAFGKESGGQQTGGAGSVAGPGEPTTSVKGAIGKAQIMPETGPEAAKLAGVPWDENKFRTDGDYNTTLGKAYLKHCLDTFGDPAKCLAAYNAGPDRVKTAIAAAAKDGTDWLTKLPKETQDYVTKIEGAFSAGKGTSNLPSENDFVAGAVQKVTDQADGTPRMEAVMKARELARQQYEVILKDRSNAADQAASRVQLEYLNNDGSNANLSPSAQEDLRTVNRLDPARGLEVSRFAKSVEVGDKQPTNMAEWNKVFTDPEGTFKGMSDAQRQNYIATNFSQSDQPKVTAMYKGWVDGSDNSATTVNTKAMKDTFDERWENLGYSAKELPIKGNASNKDANEKMYAARKFISDDITEQQTQLGRKMTPDEIQDRINTVFQQTTDIPGMIYGSKTEGMMEMSPNDIPKMARAQIVQAYLKKGVKSPSDTDVLRAYWRSRGNAVKNADQ